MRTSIITLLASLALCGIATAIPGRIDPSSKPPASVRPSVGIVDGLHDMLHGTDQAREKDPIGALTHDMDYIVDDLDHEHTDAPVQFEQKQVVSHLDKLIEQLNKQCNGGSGSSNNPTKPMADSRITRGPGGSGPMHDPKTGTKTWGQLPPRDREQILQSQNQGFPAGYEAILSSYYNRLAQEKVGDPSVDDGKSPTTKPAQ